MKKSKLLILALCISGLFQVHFIKAPGFFEGLFGGRPQEPELRDNKGGRRGRDDGFRSGDARDPRKALPGVSMPRGRNPGGGRGGVSPTGTPLSGTVDRGFSSERDGLLTPEELRRLLEDSDSPLASFTPRTKDMMSDTNEQKIKTSEALLRGFYAKLNGLSAAEGGFNGNFEEGLKALEQSSPFAKQQIIQVRTIIAGIKSEAGKGNFPPDPQEQDVISRIRKIITEIRRHNHANKRENIRAKYNL